MKAKIIIDIFANSALLLSIQNPIVIGRHPCWFVFMMKFSLSLIQVSSTYVIQDSVVSAVHCKIYAYILLSIMTFALENISFV